MQSASGLPAADVSACLVCARRLDIHQGGTALSAVACRRKGKIILVPPASSSHPAPPVVVALLQKRPLCCRQHWRLGGSNISDQPGAQPAVGRVLLPVCPVSTCFYQPVNVHALLVWMCACGPAVPPMGRVWNQGACQALPPARNCFTVCLQHGCTPACCPCRDLDSQRLTVRVLDADVGKADDLLGTTMRGLKVLKKNMLQLVFGWVFDAGLAAAMAAWCRQRRREK